MFRCSECQKEYNIKPDYCDDCGNDVFEEILPVLNEPEIKKNEPKPAINEAIQPEIKSEEFEKSISVPKKLNVDYPSLGFFIGCVLLSLFIIFFAWNPKEEDLTKKETNKQAEVKTNVNIPSINSFWDDTPPKPEVKQALVQQPVQTQAISAQPAPEIKRVEPKSVVNNTSKKQVNQNPFAPKQVSAPKTAQKTAQKTTSQPKQTSTVSKQPAAQKSVQQAAKPTQQKIVQQNQTTAKPIQTTPQKPQTQTAQTQTQVQQKPVQTVTVKDNSTLQKELSSYKVSLRNTIGRKIDFANVIGDGSCVVSFKIDSTGRLTNRAFAKQSTNSTLNDAVYKAVMATPNFSAPPSGYKGETLNLKITFYNGNFEIALN